MALHQTTMATYSYSITGGTARSSTPREYTEQRRQRMQQNPRIPPPSASLYNTDRESFRPTSSIYSEPFEAPPLPDQHYQHTYQQPAGRSRYEVSPASSYTAEDVPSSPDISPVDEQPPDMLQLENQNQAGQNGRAVSRSNIPMMRRERRQTQDAASRILRATQSKERLHALVLPDSRPKSSASSKRGYKGGEVRWDPNTGELTSSDKGRPSQVKPAEYARGLVPTGGNDLPASDEGRSPVITKTPSSGLAGFASRLRRTVQNASSIKTPEPPREATSEATPEAVSEAAPELVPESVSAPFGRPSRVVSTPIQQTASPETRSRDPSATDPAATAFLSNRPAWQGASGRTTLVAPVSDNKEVAPLSIPRKSSKRVGSSPNLRGAVPDPAKIFQNRQRMASPPASPQGDETARQKSTGQTSTPSPSPPPPHDTIQTPKPVGRAAAAMQSYPSPPPSADFPRRDSLPTQQRISQIKRKPAPSRALGSYDDNDPFNYNNKQRLATAKAAAKAAADAAAASPGPEWTQPPSRFSVTTYNSTLTDFTADFDAAETPDLPPIPQPLRMQMSMENQAQPSSSSPPRPRPTPLIVESTPKMDSVMDRRRPLCMGHASPRSIKDGVEPVMISLKTSWKSGNKPVIRDNDGYASSVSSADDRLSPLPPRFPRVTAAGSVYKDLPPPPPETTAKDRVSMLNAQLADLAQRRMNIDRCIKQMTELMPTDNLLASSDVLIKREREKSKVEGLRLELSEIQREEYEIGLKLHRAYKRLDQNAEYEPTTLWVRRVTG